MRSQAKASSVEARRRRVGAHCALSLLAALALLLFALAPASASASKGIGPAPFSPITGSSTGVTLHYPLGVGIDEESGNLFMSDGATEEVVDIFDAEGGVPSGVASPYRIDGGFEFFELPGAVAVDNSATSPSKGALYVADDVGGKVVKYLRNPATETYEEAPAAEQIVSPNFIFPSGLAVDSIGDLYVADAFAEAVFEFGPAGEELMNVPIPESVVSGPDSIAVDSAGDVFVGGFFDAKAVKFPVNGSGQIEASNFTTVASSSATGVAVDQATNTLYVALGNHVGTYDATTLAGKGEFGAGKLTATNQVAINSKTGRIYVADSGADDVAVFETLVLPEVTSGAASQVGTETATLSGTVNPEGAPLTKCAFEYGTSASYGQSVPCAESPASIGEGTSPVAVHAEISGLTEGATYHFRLVAKNASGTVNGADKSFRAAGPPEVLGESFRAHDTSAKLLATLYPGLQQTEYQFQYIDQARFEAEGFTKAASVPVPAKTVPGTEQVEVAELATGLAPSTTYHFRLIATNPSGSVEGPDKTFTTHPSSQPFEACPNDAFFRLNQPSEALPDCRAYEQASPLHKNGNNAGGTVPESKASPSGDAISFEVTGGVPGGEGAQEFPFYFAKRGAGGWSTQGMLPPASTGEIAAVAGWSPDFSHVFDEAEKLGLGTTFLDHSSTDLSLTTIVPYTNVSYSFEGTSSDGSKVFFGTGAGTQPTVAPGSALPAPGKGNLYAWQRGGALRLAGVLPDGSTPSQGSAEGIIGTDGRSYGQDNHAFAADGSSVYFTDRGTGRLYLRLNPTAPETTQKDPQTGDCVPDPVLACTVQVNASEKEHGTGLDGHDAAGPRGASFMAATPDGKVAYFTSSEKLTEDANTGQEPQPAAIARAELGGNSKELGFLPASAKGVTVHGSFIYWTDPKDHAIGRATLDGTTEVDPEFIQLPEVEVEKTLGAPESVPANPQGIAVDGEHIYWTNSVAEEGTSLRVAFQGKYAGQDVTRMICTVSSGPGSCEVTAEHNGGAGANEVQTVTFPTSFDVNSKFTLTCDGETTVETPIFHGSEEPKKQIQHALEATCGAGNFAVIGGAGLGSVGRADIDGNPASVDQEFIEGASAPKGVDVDSAHVYWANANARPNSSIPGNPDAAIARADIDGARASIEQEFIEEPAKGDIAVDATKIYFSRLNPDHNGYIRRVDIDGSDDPGWAEDIMVSNAGDAPEIAIDGSHLYWTNREEGKIARSNLDGTPASQEQELISAAAHPQGLAIDSGHIYWSANQEVQANPGNDLYRYDAAPHLGKHLTDVAPDSADENGIEAKGVLGTSEDGSYLYYVANGVPDGGVQNSPNANGETAAPDGCDPSGGTCNLYLWHEGATTFIAKLSSKSSGGQILDDSANWASTRGQAVIEQKASRTSADGRTLLFRSQRQLTVYGNEGVPEFYLYRVGVPGLLCVSCDPTGAPPTGRPRMGSLNAPVVRANSPAPILSRNLSANGKRFFFESTDALVAADINGDEGCPTVGGQFQFYPACLDVYEWEAKGEGSCRSEAQDGGCIYLISTGKSHEPSLFADASTSGFDVFFFTIDQLVRQDKDELVDVYDASEDGGLASQSVPPPIPCEGEGCQEGAKPAPQGQTAGTGTFSGPGNQAPQHKKAKKHKRKRHPAKKHKHQSKKHQAKKTGRASR